MYIAILKLHLGSRIVHKHNVLINVVIYSLVAIIDVYEYKTNMK